MVTVTVSLSAFIVVCFLLMIVFEYKKYKLRLQRLDSDMEASTQAFNEHQDAMNNDASVQAQKELVYRYKKSQLEQDLQTAYDQEQASQFPDEDSEPHLPA